MPEELPLPRSLENRVVLVSGIGPGLGRQLALASAQAGASVVVGSRTEAALKAVVDEIATFGGRAVYETCDTTSSEDCRRLVAAAEHHFGGLDCIVANAFHKGGMTVNIEDTDLDDWRAVFEVNVLGSLRMAQAALPALRRRGGGSIVLVNSQIVRRVKPGRGDYAATKAALLTAGQVLAKEVGRENIRVNSVVPGRMWGEPLIEYSQGIADATGRTLADVQTDLLGDMTLPFIPTDEQVARVIVFLASDMAAGITGQSIDVNGGETFH
jgi:NAD(P)-dependent dehydrogenase (short-subunit alcohol dehydrogenase family)